MAINIEKTQTQKIDLGLRSFIKENHNQTLKQRVSDFSEFIKTLKRDREHTYFRQIDSIPDKKVTVLNGANRGEQEMLMFASNNYLGLASNSYIKKKIKQEIDHLGTGVGGPAILNGYTSLMKKLERRLATLKHQEDCLIFPSGYSTNLGFVSALVGHNDIIIYDELSHASLYDGLRMSNANHVKFIHNDLVDLDKKLKTYSGKVSGSIYVCMEGIYSMDGDLAPLDKMVPMIKKYGAISMLDDAHGTGVLGEFGSGTADHFGVSGDIDLSMGTFSKVFAVTGGFIAAKKEVITYLRYFARPYMFSAALPPMMLAAVMAGIDILETQPKLRAQLIANAQFARSLLAPLSFLEKSDSPIIALRVPEWMNIRKANYLIHKKGIFINAVEYPAVPYDMQRFRISLMAQHTKGDIRKLARVITEVWNDDRVKTLN